MKSRRSILSTLIGLFGAYAVGAGMVHCATNATAVSATGIVSFGLARGDETGIKESIFLGSIPVEAVPEAAPPIFTGEI